MFNLNIYKLERNECKGLEQSSRRNLISIFKGLYCKMRSLGNTKQN